MQPSAHRIRPAEAGVTHGLITCCGGIIMPGIITCPGGAPGRIIGYGWPFGCIGIPTGPDAAGPFDMDAALGGLVAGPGVDCGHPVGGAPGPALDGASIFIAPGAYPGCIGGGGGSCGWCGAGWEPAPLMAGDAAGDVRLGPAMGAPGWCMPFDCADTICGGAGPPGHP
jgi:hypothetical protein